MNYQTKPISELKEWSKNPRSISKDGYARLKKQIQDLKIFKPFIITPDGEVLGGNMRLKVVRELGITDVPVSIVDAKTEEEKLAYALADNDRAGFYDEDLLANLTAEYPQFNWQDYAIDLKEPINLGELLDSFKEVIEDEVPEVPTEAISKLGEVYQLGRHRLMCGDACKIEDVEKLMDGTKADMVFTDPPYGMNLDTDYTDLAWGDRKGKKYEKVIGDNEDFKPELIKTIFDNFGYCKEMFVWGADYFYKLIPDFDKGHFIVWDKTLASNGDAGSNSEYELLWTKEKHKRQVLHFNWFRYFGLSKQDSDKRIHPTQKPLQVLTPIIKSYSKDKGIIIDLFGGSGSTLIACEQTNRICYMMEIDPKYCDVIRKRYWKFTHDNKEEGWEEGTKPI